MANPTLKVFAGGLAAVGLLSTTMLMAPPARAQDSDPMDRRLYIGAGAGLNEATDSTPSSGNTYDFGSGYNVLGTIGYRWTPNIRTELELDYRRAPMSSINGIGASGAQKTLAFSGNVLYDFNNNSRFTPYVGGGVGIARTRWSNVGTGGASIISDSDNSLQWQLIGGVSTPISPRTALYVDYRYIGVADATLRGAGGAVVSDHSDRSHNVTGGVRFFF